MDYEKMYKAVLETATQWIKDGCSDKEKICLESIFPELRKSEDERIIVRLIEYFQGFLEGYEDCYKDGGCVKWEGLDVKSILAWLEKQKETANSFTDGIIEVRSFQRGMEEGRKLETQKEPGIKWLKSDNVKNPDKPYVDKAGIFYTTDGRMCYASEIEQQKENPKSTDFVPSDCVSDAKCEDRWHKVSDSMPDNPREVLCKDEAGNYFIGRYYVGEGWEISNYDDEDKPHHLNPPVSKWIDFPSEKQKESLRDFIDNFPYSDEQKEQKPAEWSDEDEKMMNLTKTQLRILQSHLSHAHSKSMSDMEYSSRLLQIEKCVSWLDIRLKTLRPQPKAELTLLDENIIKAAVAFVEQNDHFNCWGGIDKHTVIKALRSLKSHWKPSEEQMEALRLSFEEAFNDAGDCNRHRQLKSLYEQLKKL